MEAGDARLFQQRDEDRKLFLRHTGVAEVRILLPDSQLVINGHPRDSRPDGPDGLHRKAGAVLCAAAVFVGAMVEEGRAEAAAHPVAVHLHHVEARLSGQQGGFPEPVEDALELALGQLGDVGADGIVQLLPQLVGGELLRQEGGKVLEHRQQVGVALVELGAELAVCGVGDLCKLLIKGKALGIEERLLKPAFAHRDIPDDDHGAAALGECAVFCKGLLVRQAEGGGRKKNAVLQPQPAIIDGA